MRILLDENIDRRLKPLFDRQHKVVTVSEYGWSGEKNGALLQLAAKEFDAFITMDQNIQYQQNLAAYNLGIVLVKAHSNRRQDVEPAIPKINRMLKKLKFGEMLIVKA